jgi:hypothetical protein
MMNKADAKYDKFLTFLRAIENEERIIPSTSSTETLDSDMMKQMSCAARQPN